MSELHAIESALQRTAQRRRLDNALRGACRGLFVASIVWLVALIVYKLTPVPFSTLVIAGGAGLACVLVGAILGGWRKTTTREMALWVDVKQNLKERLSTALEVGQMPANGEWKSLLVADATQHAQGLDAKKMLPLHLPRVTRWALLLLASNSRNSPSAPSKPSRLRWSRRKRRWRRSRSWASSFRKFH
jgi:hypothetical protein